MKKIYTLKVLIPFRDLQSEGVKRKKNDEFECSEERAKEILSYKDKLVEIVSINKK